MSRQGNQQAGPPPPAAIAARLAMAYIASQAMNVATDLGIADLLGNGAMTSSEIARATGTRAAMMHRLLRALAAFEIVKDLGSGTFELTPAGDCLRADAPNSVRSLVLLFASRHFWQTFACLGECVKTGMPQTTLRPSRNSSGLKPVAWWSRSRSHCAVGRRDLLV